MRAWLRVQTDANAPDGAGPCQRFARRRGVARPHALFWGLRWKSSRQRLLGVRLREAGLVHRKAFLARRRHRGIATSRSSGAGRSTCSRGSTARHSRERLPRVRRCGTSLEPVRALSGLPPSPRHSHAAVVHRDSFYVFGGYDGSLPMRLPRVQFRDAGLGADHG